MGRYLTNVDVATGLERSDYVAATRDAARKAGVPVQFRLHPIPGSPGVPDDPRKGSLYLDGGSLTDLGEFWSLYNLALARIQVERQEGR